MAPTCDKCLRRESEMVELKIFIARQFDAISQRFDSQDRKLMVLIEAVNGVQLDSGDKPTCIGANEEVVANVVETPIKAMDKNSTTNSNFVDEEEVKKVISRFHDDPLIDDEEETTAAIEIEEDERPNSNSDEWTMDCLGPFQMGGQSSDAGKKVVVEEIEKSGQMLASGKMRLNSLIERANVSSSSFNATSSSSSFNAASTSNLVSIAPKASNNVLMKVPNQNGKSSESGVFPSTSFNSISMVPRSNPIIGLNTVEKSFNTGGGGGSKLMNMTSTGQQQQHIPTLQSRKSIVQPSLNEASKFSLAPAAGINCSTSSGLSFPYNSPLNEWSNSSKRSSDIGVNFDVCSICSKRFSSGKALSRHKYVKHNGGVDRVLKFQCKFCDKQYSWPECLHRHVSTAHKN